MKENVCPLEQLRAQIESCQSCPLYQTRNKAVPGEGPQSAKIMFIGEAPGEVNNQMGIPFVGHGGKIFDKILQSCGLLREEVFITNALKCWPPENRTPKTSELAACRPFLEAQLALIKPKMIVTLGTKAFFQMTGKAIRLKDEHGNLIKRDGRIICPTFHPNAIRYVAGGMKTIITDMEGLIKEAM